MFVNIEITIKGGPDCEALMSTDIAPTREQVADKLNELAGLCIAESAVYIKILSERPSA